MSNYIKWGGLSEDGSDGDKKWKNADLNWGDYQLIVEADIVFKERGGKSKKRQLDKWLDKEPDKKKRLIKLIAIVKGETFEETKEVEEIEVKVKDVELLIKEVLNKIIVEKVDV